MPIRRLLKEKYWFKPYRWGEIAIYYPITFPGWAVTGFSILFMVYFLGEAAAVSSTFDQAVIFFIPRAIIVFLVFDLFCFRTGEYPKWWKDHTWHKSEFWRKHN